MNWRKLLGLEKQPDKKVPERILNIDPKCPYCGYEFSEMPKRKRKCPECKKVIHRKYYPVEKTKRLVTEQKAAKIDQAWEQHYVNEEIEQIGRAKYNEFRIPLVNEGKNPSHADVLINMYNWESENAFHRKDFVNFRNSLSKLSNVYYENNDYFNTLKCDLQTAYFLLNGHYSNGRFRDYGKTVPPGVLTPLKNCIAELGLSEGEVHSLFTKLNTMSHHIFDTPAHPQDIWHDQLKDSLFKKNT